MTMMVRRLLSAKGGGKDHDGDGKVESSSKEHAGVVHNAIQRKKGGKPDGQDTRKEEVEIEEGVRDLDPEKGTKERKAKLEKKRGMKLDDHPQYTKEETEEVEEGIDFKGAAREQARRDKIQAEKDKKSPSSKDYRLALRKFRPGASQCRACRRWTRRNA